MAASLARTTAASAEKKKGKGPLDRPGKEPPRSGRRRWALYAAATLLGVLAVGAIAFVVVRARAGKSALSPSEQQLAAAINHARATLFLPSLAVDPALCQLAKRQARQAADESRVIELPKSIIEEQLTGASYPAEGWGFDTTVIKDMQPPKEAVLNLMNQGAPEGDAAAPGPAKKLVKAKRKRTSLLNLFNPEFRDIGIAISQGTDGRFYVVVVYGRKKSA